MKSVIWQKSGLERIMARKKIIRSGFFFYPNTKPLFRAVLLVRVKRVFVNLLVLQACKPTRSLRSLLTRAFHCLIVNTFVKFFVGVETTTYTLFYRKYLCHIVVATLFVCFN